MTIELISLIDHFNRFITDIEKELADPSIIPKDIVDCFCHYLSLQQSGSSYTVQKHILEIVKATTPQRMWRYLVDRHFVQYMNINLVGKILPDIGSITKLISDYDDHQRKFLDQTDFIVLLEILSTRSEYLPRTISGLPTILMSLKDPYTSISILRWNQILLDSFTESSFFFITNITKSESVVNIEYSVLPIGVSDTIKKLNDSDRLKYVGITIVNMSDLMEFENSKLNSLRYVYLKLLLSS